MENDKIIRQLQIDLITDTPNDIITWFNDLWSKLYIIETDVYHNDGGELIYYTIIDGINYWTFYQDNANERFWCDYENYWSDLEFKFKFEYNGIQSITKVLVENALNNSVATPESGGNRIQIKVENALNNSIPTPMAIEYNLNNTVENALNNGVATPISNNFISSKRVENALDNSVAIPICFVRQKTERVENAMNKTVHLFNEVKNSKDK